jgi:predicted kinase
MTVYHLGYELPAEPSNDQLATLAAALNQDVVSQGGSLKLSVRSCCVRHAFDTADTLLAELGLNATGTPEASDMDTTEPATHPPVEYPLAWPLYSSLPTAGPALIICRGLPGSGKTTWATTLTSQHSGTYVRVNRDDIHHMLYGKYRSDARSQTLVTRIQHYAISAALYTGQVVISDDTNLNPDHVDQLKQVSLQVCATPAHIADTFLQVTPEQCIRRDARRPNPVGADVIHRMAAVWGSQINPPHGNVNHTQET